MSSNQSSVTLSAWRRLSTKPAGKWAFSRLVCWKAPYFGSIRPKFTELRPGYCEVHIKKRRAVLNHIGTVHAIAMCNMAELAGGTMLDATIPSTHRWIPKGMTVEYLKKAQTDLKAVAALNPLPEFGPAAELPVTVNVVDAGDQTVFRAVIAMWVSPKK
ncbi:MAG: hotdog fold domain-containing protein [Gammaproteobacteria bacterium]